MMLVEAEVDLARFDDSRSINHAPAMGLKFVKLPFRAAAPF